MTFFINLVLALALLFRILNVFVVHHVMKELKIVNRLVSAETDLKQIFGNFEWRKINVLDEILTKNHDFAIWHEFAHLGIKILKIGPFQNFQIGL